jgi:2-C-methyl-D-erythritol 4-phosphate cytidylyltransferase
MPLEIDLSKASATHAIAIIAAAGAGKRLGANIPKQYLKINDSSILDICLKQFVDYPQVKQVILVVSADDEFYPKLNAISHEKVKCVIGGKDRIDSVANALNYLIQQGVSADTPIMVHDGARPCITHRDLDKLWSHYLSTSRACFLAAPVVDTLQKTDGSELVVSAVDRDNIMRAFTPQMASLAQLEQAFSQQKLNQGQYKHLLGTQHKALMTDEVSVLTAAGYPVDVVIGRSDNIKVTYEDDLALAEFYLNRQDRKDG